MTCHEAGHTWGTSCLYTNFELTSFVFYEGVKLYLPIYLVGTQLLYCLVLQRQTTFYRSYSYLLGQYMHPLAIWSVGAPSRYLLGQSHLFTFFW